MIKLLHPEQCPTEIGVVQDAERADGRTAGSAHRRELVVVVEHPRRGRDITGTATSRWGITCHFAPTVLSRTAAAECITLITVVFSCTSRAVATCDSFDYSTTGIFYRPSTSR